MIGFNNSNFGSLMGDKLYLINSQQQSPTFKVFSSNEFLLTEN